MSYRLALPERPPTAVVVAIHGLVESAACLEAAFPDWVSAGWAVLALDMRGHGHSPRWSDDDLQRHPGDVMVQDVLKTFSAPELQVLASLPALYYGHSAGGAVAAAVATAALQSGRGTFAPAAVLLEDPFWRLPVTPFQERTVAESAHAHLIDVQSRTAPERRGIRRREWPYWSAAEILRSCQAQEDCDPRIVLNGNAIPTTPWPDLVATLTDFRVPVLIVTGTVRTGITAEHQRIALAAGARIEVFEGASHFIRRDMEDRFMRTAGSFFTASLAAIAPAASSLLPLPSGI